LALPRAPGRMSTGLSLGRAMDPRFEVCPIKVVRSLGLLAPDLGFTGLRLPGLGAPVLHAPSLLAPDLRFTGLRLPRWVPPDLRRPILRFLSPSGTHLRRPQARDGPEEHWRGLGPDLERLVKGLERLVAHEAKLLVWAEFRHDVVVVSVKPLGHLERGNTTVFAVPPPGHGKVGV